MRLALLPVLCALAACGSSQAEPEDRPASICTKKVFEQSRFTHCTVDPADATISIRLNGSDGMPMRSFDKLAQSTPVDTIYLAMNAGMFGEDGRPIGLYVEHGKPVVPLNRNEGPGNFHLLPNGVFWSGDNGWHVDTSDHYATLNMAEPPPFATQSGPMLVIDGELHPDFAEDGTSRHFRNGVGVDKAGKVHFVISDDLVSFGKFARFFRDEAETPDALYLDGAVSALWDPQNGRKDGAPPLGPLIVVTKPAKADR